MLRFVAQHRRIGVAGTDAVDPDLIGAVVDRHRLGQQHHGALGGAVGRGTPAAGQTPARGGVDDRAAAGLGHHRDRLLRHQEDRLDVHRHQPVPFLFGRFEQVGTPDDARVVDQDVETAERGHGPLDRAAAIVRAAHVARDEERAPTRSRDGSGDGLAARLVYVHHGHRRARLGEDVGGGPSDPRRAAGDQRDLVGQRRHRGPVRRRPTLVLRHRPAPSAPLPE